MSRKQNLHSRITQVVVVQIHLSHHREVPSYRNTDISRQYYGMPCHDLRATGWDKSSTAVRTSDTGREETDGSQPEERTAEPSLPMKRTATLLPKASQMNTLQDPPKMPPTPQDHPKITLKNLAQKARRANAGKSRLWRRQAQKTRQDPRRTP